MPEQRSRQVNGPVLLCGAAIAAAGIAAYSRTFSVPFLFDDTVSISDNTSIRHWAAALWPPTGSTASGRPVLNLTLALNYAISGTSVWSYHVLNLLIHILAGLTLFGIVRRTLPRGQALNAVARASSPWNPNTGWKPVPLLSAFAIALIWTLHPLQTESVTYIIQRAESLMGLFYLLTLYFFIRSAEKTESGKRKARSENMISEFGPRFPLSAFRFPLFSFVACVLGMATKEVMVSAPLIVFLYDRTFLAGSFREAWRRRWRMHAALAATWIILPFLALSTHGRGSTAGFRSGVPWGTYALNQFPAVAHYLRLCFWPHPLVFDYGTALTATVATALPGALLVGGLAAATAWALVRRPALGFLGAWFFAILAPSSSVVPVATEPMAEHRMYLPLAAVVVAAVCAGQLILGQALLDPVLRHRCKWAALLVAALACGCLTVRRNETYQSEDRIWDDTLAKRPGNERAHNNVGNDLEKIPGHADEAIAQYEEALRLRPGYPEAHFNLACQLATKPGRLHEAIFHFEEAVRLKPDFAAAHFNLGRAFEKEGRLDDAVAQYQEALRYKPDFTEAHDSLGNVWSDMPGRLDDAIAQFEAGLRSDPDNAAVHNDLGYALAKAPGRTQEAIAQFEESLRLAPTNAEAHNNLACALSGVPGRSSEAIAQFEEALRLAPENAGIHFDFALVLSRIPGHGREAVNQLDTVLRIQPDNQAARDILARMGGSAP